MRKSLIVFNDPKAPASEAYRMVRTNLEYTNIDKENRIFLFTSAKMSEGKSTTICNVAATLAQGDNKVLLIDCDLRKPRLHKLLGLSNNFGVSSVITGQKPLLESIQIVVGVPNLSVITSGPIPPMPSEMLGSKRMEQIIEELSMSFDYILIDSPPILSVTDSTILASKVDGVILAIAVGETHIDAIKTAIKALEKVDANILGTILTKAKANKKGYYYQYDYS